MKRRGWFFVWLLPLLWMVTSVLSFQWPGDEYGLWSFGSLAGLWIVYLIGNIGNTARIAIFVIIAGSVSMVPLGLLLDMLRVRRRLWLFAIPAVRRGNMCHGAGLLSIIEQSDQQERFDHGVCALLFEHGDVRRHNRDGANFGRGTAGQTRAAARGELGRGAGAIAHILRLGRWCSGGAGCMYFVHHYSG